MSQEPKPLFIYKPQAVSRDKRLTPVEQDYLCLIAQLEKAGGCYASNNYFAEYFGVTREAAIGVLNKLRGIDRRRGESGRDQVEFVKSEIVERQGKRVALRRLTIVDEISKQNLLSEGKRNATTAPDRDFEGQSSKFGKKLQLA